VDHWGSCGVLRFTARLLLALVLAGLWPCTLVAHAGGFFYTVRGGENLWDLAEASGTTAEALVAANHLYNPDWLFAGQVLWLPREPERLRTALADGGGPSTAGDAPVEAEAQACAPVTHQVAEGETLSGIAARYGVSLDDLAAVNHISNPSLIWVGQNLLVPHPACPGLPPLRDPFLEVTWQPEAPKPGDVILLSVRTTRPLPALHAALGGQEIAFASTDSQSFTAWAGLSATVRPGLALLRLRPEGEPAQFTAIPVQALEFPVERLWLPPDRFALLAPEIVVAENELLDRICLQFRSDRLWDGRLQHPLGKPVPVISAFGTRRAYNDGPFGSYHGGTDFSSPEGSPVYAAASGVVVLARPLQVRGNTVIVDHGGGVFTLYCHLSEFSVAEGMDVAAGHQLGLVGNTGLSTGPHLHWELRVQGVRVDPVRRLVQ
jgi:murein DD-endopeptidase MepM/ murein hydrolase activator NlpD